MALPCKGRSVKRYPNVFQGTGKLEGGHYKLEIEENDELVFHLHRGKAKARIGEAVKTWNHGKGHRAPSLEFGALSSCKNPMLP